MSPEISLNGYDKFFKQTILILNSTIKCFPHKTEKYIKMQLLHREFYQRNNVVQIVKELIGKLPATQNLNNKTAMAAASAL
jgi:hypothetical protein